MEQNKLGIPTQIKDLLLGDLSERPRAFWIGALVLLIVLVPVMDYMLGRGSIHLNLYPLPIMLSIFLFRKAGLSSVLILLLFYHVVQVRLGMEARTVMLNNVAQLGLTFLIGLLCCWLVDTYRDLYAKEATLATTRHELLLNLSHELRSPLFAVRGIVKNLSRNISKLDEVQLQDQLNDAQAAIAAINRDVEGLTQVFRGDLQELEPRLQVVSVKALLEGVVKRYPVEYHPDHTIMVEPLSENRNVTCDPLLTQQILDNLLCNSLRHTSKGQVVLSSEQCGPEVRFRVTDEGPGIPSADRERIFHRHDKGSRPSSTGFGVGLYLVDVYTKAQGGRIVVDDVPQGASFSVYLRSGDTV